MSTSLTTIGLPRPRFLAKPKPKPAWKGVLAAADAAEQKFIVAILSAARVGRQSVDVDGVAHALASHDYKGVDALLSRAVAEATRMIELRLPRLILDTMAAGGEAAAASVRRSGSFRAAKKGPLGDLHFDLVNPEALKWARTKAGSMVRGINVETQNAIRRAISRSFAEGIPTRQVAVILRESIGLDQRRMDAVLNLRNRLEASPGGLVYAGKTPIRVPAAGASKAFLEVKTKAYAQRLLNQRAESIARTEAISASNEGQRQLWLQAVKKDLLFADELREWIVTGDRRLCPQCEASAGDLAPLDKPFPNGSMGPPLHPMCRCTTGISGKRGKKAYVDPQKELDRLLAPAAGDSLYGGNLNPSAAQSDLARAIADGFKGRVAALEQKRVIVNISDEFGAVGAKPKPLNLAADNMIGRANICAVDTAMAEMGTAIDRLRAVGAVGAEEPVVLRFYSGGPKEYAHADTAGVFEVNLRMPAWQSKASIRQHTLRDFQIGFHPTPDSDSIIVHELGHLQHLLTARRKIEALKDVTAWDRMVDMSWSARDWGSAVKMTKWQPLSAWQPNTIISDYPRVAEKIAQKVSRYAAENSAEFIAETFTGRVYGKDYDAEVMDLYRALGGPEFKPLVKKVEKEIGKAVVEKLVPRPAIPLPQPKPEKIFKAVRPVPPGEAGDLIRTVQALRAEGLDYTAIARKMGWDVTPRGVHRGPGPGPVKVSSILKRFGDPLERIAPRPL